VASEGAAAVARCSFCSADNLLGVARVEREVAGREEDLGTLAARIQDEALGVRDLAERLQRRLYFTAAGSAIVGWGFFGMAACLLSIIVFDAETPIVRDKRYVWWPSENGLCLGEVEVSRSGRVRIDSDEEVDLTSEEAADLSTFGIEAIVGMEVERRRSFGRIEPAKVVRVYGTRAGSNHIELEMAEDGALREVVQLHEICRVDDSPDPSSPGGRPSSADQSP